ncbi:MAG: energy transducer TonB [Bacteroidota bacterium]|nr:energy transducer TonB [Bacteroidota bacterium]
MKVKKSPKVDLENYKSAFILTGLAVVIGLTLVAFNWKTDTSETEGFAAREVVTDDEMTEITRQDIEPPEPEPEPEQQETPEVINIVDDSEDFESDFDFDASMDENEEIEIVNIEENEEEDTQVFVVVEKMPEFKGGQLALRKYIAENMEYPVVAQENDIQGTVYIRFVVKKNGKVGEVQLQRGVDPLLDDEAIRVIKTLPDFTPGRQGGKPVNVWFSVPVKFKLQ